MNKKKIIWAIVSLFIAALSIWMVIAQSKSFTLDNFAETIRQASKLWLIAAFVCMFGFIWFEGLAVIRIARCFGYRPTKRQGVVYAGADVYFSAITPSATGGQPASAYFMLKDGMSLPSVTITLLLNVTLYTAALFILGVVNMIVGVRYFFIFSTVSKILICIGFAAMAGLIFVFWMLITRAGILHRVCLWIIALLEKLHLSHHADEQRKKLEKIIADYRACSELIGKNRRVFIKTFMFNVCQKLSQFAVSFMVFMALGKGVAKSFSAMIIQCFVGLGSYIIPIPGSMGVADYIMLDGFTELVGADAVASTELLCRGITFYSCVIVGGIIFIIGYLARRKHVRIL